MLFWCHARHCLTVLHVHVSGVQICKSNLLFIRRFKRVLVRVRPHLVHDESCMHFNEVPSAIVGERLMGAPGDTECLLHRLRDRGS